MNIGSSMRSDKWLN